MSGKPRRGICAECKKGPKLISSVHPTTGENICRTCSRKLATGFHQGICAECKREMDVPYRHPETRKPICPACYQRHRKHRKGKKIKPETGPVQSPVSVSHPEIRHPEDLIGKEVMDIGSLSLRVGTIARVDFFEKKEVEVDFDGVRKRYSQRELSDLVFFTEAAKDFKKEQVSLMTSSQSDLERRE